MSLGFGLGFEGQGNLQAREAGLVRDEASGCAAGEQRVGEVQQAVARARTEEVRGLLGEELALATMRVAALCWRWCFIVDCRRLIRRVWIGLPVHQLPG